jgi:hypothetical protein
MSSLPNRYTLRSRGTPLSVLGLEPGFEKRLMELELSTVERLYASLIATPSTWKQELEGVFDYDQLLGRIDEVLSPEAKAALQPNTAALPTTGLRYSSSNIRPFGKYRREM